jgi:hypothetical protein
MHSPGNSHPQRSICILFMNCFAFHINSTTNRILFVMLTGISVHELLCSKNV